MSKNVDGLIHIVISQNRGQQTVRLCRLREEQDKSSGHADTQVGGCFRTQKTNRELAIDVRPEVADFQACEKICISVFQVDGDCKEPKLDKKERKVTYVHVLNELVKLVDCLL